MRKKLLYPVLIAFSATLISCGGGGGGGSSTSTATSPADTPAAQSEIAVTNVNKMMVAPDGLVSSAAVSIQSFYKVMQAALGINNVRANASKNQVYSIDPNGRITPSDIATLVAGKPTTATSDLVIDSPNFLIFRFNGLFQPISGGGTQQCVLLGVRKTDGKFACVKSNPRCDSINSCQVSSYLSQIKVDPSGNIFYIVLGDGGLEKVDLTDPAKPIYSSVFTHAAVGDASYPVVNAQADVMTTINLMSGSTLSTRIYAGSTLKYTVSESTIGCSFAGPSTDSSNFYYTAAVPNSPVINLFKLTRDPATGNYTKSTINTSPDGSNGLSMNGGLNCARVIQQGDSVYTIGYKPLNSNPGNILYEPLRLNSGSATPTFYSLSTDYGYLADLQAYTGGLAVLGVSVDENSHGIQRFNTSTKASLTVLPVGQYKIKSITVSQDGAITFIGTALAGGGAVIGTITAANVLTVNGLAAEPTSIATIK
jgi:hypothetical protein